MDHSGASAYVYAKACGMLSRSYVGPRASKLFSVKSLPELWSLLFKEEVPSVPEVLLARKIEEKAVEKFMGEYGGLVSMYSKPDKIVIDLLHHYDFENLKIFGGALALGKKDRPQINDITPYNILNYKAWPDIARITQDTELSWYNKVPEVLEQQALDNRLDIQFIKTIWKSASALPAAERKPVQELIALRYSIQNMLWVLRLKVYYKMSAEEIIERLAFLDRSAGKDDVLAGKALEIIDKNALSYDDWASWKYADYLNPHEEGVVWSVDPRWVEERAKKEFFRKVLKNFHIYPFTAMVLVSWFFIKARELDYIRTAVEALRMDIDENQALEMSGI